MAKKIIRGFIDVFAAVILLVALISSCLVHGVFNAQTAADAVCNDEFYETLKVEFVEGFEAFGGVIDVSGAEVLNAVGEENVKNYARQYTVDFFDAMHNGTEFEPKEFNDGNLKEYVYGYIREFEPDITEENLNEIYELIFNNAESSVKYLPGIVQQVIPTANRVFNIINFLSDIEVFLYILFVVLVAISIVLTDKNKYVDTVYGILSAMFCVLAVAAIPLFMIMVYDVPSKLVLDAPVLLQFVRGINTLVFVDGAVITGIAFIVTAVAVIAMSVYLSIKKSKEILEKTVDKN